MTKVSFHGREIEISDLCRVMYSGEDVLKGDVLNYYFRVAPIIMRHVEGRLVSTRRRPCDESVCPRGAAAAPDPTPPWVRAALVDGAGLGRPLMVMREPAALAYLVQQSCVTPYASLNHATSPRLPDRIVFDLDPPPICPSAYAEVCEAAVTLRRAVEDHGLIPFVMTSGSRGLHVHVPLLPLHDVEAVSMFAADVARQIVATDRCRFAVAGTDPGGGKVTIDHRRNGCGQLVVAPYGLRARPGAPVATPLDWSELGSTGAHPTNHTMASIFERLTREGDPWRDIARSARSLPSRRSGLQTSTQAVARGRRATALSHPTTTISGHALS
jgi:bifunctional non-homologous end joining protein LigD